MKQNNNILPKEDSFQKFGGAHNEYVILIQWYVKKLDKLHKIYWFIKYGNKNLLKELETSENETSRREGLINSTFSDKEKFTYMREGVTLERGLTYFQYFTVRLGYRLLDGMIILKKVIGCWLIMAYIHRYVPPKIELCWHLIISHCVVKVKFSSG